MKKVFWAVAVVLIGCADSSPTIDGHTYKTVKIGDQEWFAENLKTTVYANGDEIPYSRTNESWKNQKMGMRCSYEHDDAMNAKYGQLYNWYAVNDERGLCPSGWHVPSDEDWQDLEVFLGMSRADVSLEGDRGSDELGMGTKLKAKSGWRWNEGGNGTDDFGFSALAGGYRSHVGNWNGEGNYGYFWSSSPLAIFAWNRALYSGNAEVYRDYLNQQSGFSVRCLRDAE